jgi:SAM-dependent methyltransferase
MREQAKMGIVGPPTESDVTQAGAEYDRWRRKNRYYYDQLTRLFRRHVPVGASVLDVGCEGGDLLAALKPGRGVGVDANPALIEAARRRHSGLEFVVGEPKDLPAGEAFDAVVICNSVGAMEDVQGTLSALRPLCRPDTRVIVAYYNALWEPILTLGSRLGLRRRVPGQNWLSRDDLTNLLMLAGFDVVSIFCEILFPKWLPFASAFLNRFLVKFWPFKHLALATLVVARPVRQALDRDKTRVTVVVPTRNECGNIEPLVRRTPEMGAGTEIIFVDGWSSDGTQGEIQRCITAYPQRRMRLILQEGQRGKAQAVRQGFEAATGDVLIILDGDLTVAPEDLPKFFEALADGLGEFINGTRLVYPLGKQAMRFLNKCGNRFFSILFTWLIGQRFRDTLCGTKVLTRRSYQRIAAGRPELGLLDPFGDFDLIFGAARCDLKIIEIPVRYGARAYGQTNINRFRDFWLLLAMGWRAFLKIKLR